MKKSVCTVAYEKKALLHSDGQAFHLTSLNSKNDTDLCRWKYADEPMPIGTITGHIGGVKPVTVWIIKT